MIHYLRLQDAQDEAARIEAEFERDLLINNFELWQHIYGDANATGPVVPTSEEEFEAMAKAWEESGWGG